MKCEFCKKEFSDAVLPAHLLRCEAKPKVNKIEIEAQINTETKADESKESKSKFGKNK